MMKNQTTPETKLEIKFNTRHLLRILLKLTHSAATSEIIRNISTFHSLYT